MKKFFINLLSGTIENVGESQLEEVLQKLHDTDLEAYKAAVYAGRTLVKKLKPLVEKSESKIDDLFLNAVNDALTDSAKANNLELQD